MLFKQQVICRCAVVVPVSFDAFFCELILKSKLDSLFKDFIINWNSVISNDDPVGKVNCRRRNMPPSVFSDLIDVETFGRVCVQYVSQHIL